MKDKDFVITKEFKKMIVNLCETNKDKTMSDIAREYGITRTSITNWRKNTELLLHRLENLLQVMKLKLQKKNKEFGQKIEI